jgi:hypothetical protein
MAANGKYSSASAYNAFFQGTTEVDYAKALWKNLAPLKKDLLLVGTSEPMLDCRQIGKERVGCTTILYFLRSRARKY